LKNKVYFWGQNTFSPNKLETLALLQSLTEMQKRWQARESDSFPCNQPADSKQFSRNDLFMARWQRNQSGRKM